MRSADKLMIIELREPLRDVISQAKHQHATRVNIPAGRTQITQTWRVSLLMENEHIKAVALVRRRSRTGDFDQLIEILHPRKLYRPAQWNDLAHSLPTGTMDHLRYARDWNGIIPPKTGERTIAALDSISGGVREIIAELRRLAPREEPSLSPGHVTAKEQRDAVALGLEIAGIDSRAALDDHEVAPDAPFLANISRATVHESAVLRHDASRFANWMEQNTAHFDVWRFVDPKESARAVTVLYADKGSLEELTGTDLIYYREESQAFVLVQYKRMRAEGERLLYRPNKQLDLQIARMRALNLVDTPATTVDEVRLSAEPYFIKLVEPDIFRPEGNRLAKGMYFSLELFDLLRNDVRTRGPQGGVAIGWSNARRYLTNGQFVSMVRDSWIGTRGAGTSKLSQFIRETLDEKRGLAVVHDHTKFDDVYHRRG